MLRNKDIQLQELLGNNIQRVRNSLGKSQEWLAEEVDTSQVQISRIESGTTNVSSVTLYKISRVLEVKIDNLFDTE
jgi:transcriptional regulator with XRE-family HTH domain